MKKYFLSIAMVLMLGLVATACSKDEKEPDEIENPGTQPDPDKGKPNPDNPDTGTTNEDKGTFTVNPTTIPTFGRDGGQKKIYVLTTKQDFSIAIAEDCKSWVSVDITSGHKGENYPTVTIAKTDQDDPRTGTITISAEGFDPVTISISQNGAKLYPSYNTNPIEPDQTGMTHSAKELVELMGAGWNNGNALEIPGNETDWGNPKINQALVDAVYEAGFRNIRIPCAWSSHAGKATCKISDTYMNRVKEVVNYAYNKYSDMYIVINCHWDGGWLQEHVGNTVDDDVNARQQALWEQIATEFRDYDERLLFAGANEPCVDKGEKTASTVKTLNVYLQTFIDAVRSTGGKNAYRTLIVQGMSTDCETALKVHKHTNLPKDNIEGRMMFELHYYTPYQYCLMEKDANWGKMFYYWGDENKSATDPTRNCGDYGNKAWAKNILTQVKKEYCDNGIPVYIGECSPHHLLASSNPGLDQNLHDASIKTFLKDIFGMMHEYGMVPVYWDNGYVNQNNASGLFKRSEGKLYYTDFMNGIREAFGLEDLE